VWDVAIEDRREPLHGGLTAAIPAADILASHTPYLHKVNHFLSIKGVIVRRAVHKSKAPLK
ncbi:MAG: hypothetical protein Q8R93_13875, partial [Methylicorpusculum sp.]|nr:hypothetical protein [Methylicorpusculum sp.]